MSPRHGATDEPAPDFSWGLSAVIRLRRYRIDLIVTAFILATIGLLAAALGADTLAYFTLLGAMSTGALGVLVWLLSAAVDVSYLLARGRAQRGEDCSTVKKL